MSDASEPHAFPTHGSGAHPESNHPPEGDQTAAAQGEIAGEAAEENADATRAARIAARQAERAAAAEAAKIAEEAAAAEAAARGESPEEAVAEVEHAAPAPQFVYTPRVNPTHSTGPTTEPPYEGYGR